MDTYIFSGYARLPHDVSHQALYNRLGVIVEVDEQGRIVAAGSTLIMDVGRDFFSRLVTGKSVVSERDEILRLIHERYLGHSQGALHSAMQKVFESVDRSPLGGAAVPEPALSAEGGHSV
jgi:hypothetical protein